MKIRSLELKHIGVFEDETINFPVGGTPQKKGEGAEIHILTGENGTGKTTILQALASGILNYGDITPKIVFKSKTLLNFHRKLRGNNSNAGIIFSNDDYQPCIFELFLDDDFKKMPHNFIKSILPFGYEYLKHEEPDFNVEYANEITAFGYSGNRFVESIPVSVKENKKFNPLDNALEFQRNYEDGDSINQWLVNTISKRANARERGNEQRATAINRNIINLENFIGEILEKQIKIVLDIDPVIEVKVNIDNQEKELDFDLLPDGLRSIISWIGDLLMRMDALKWKNDTPVFEREFILFLDEIEVHLHPRWQRKILPVVQKLFKNAQIFITTHSPFIVNSVDGAWIYELDLDENGNSKVTKIRESNTADSYQNIIREIFEVSRFSESLEKELKAFTDDRNDILLKKEIDEQAFLERANNLANRNDEVKNTILFELRQLSKKIGKEFVL